MAGVEEAFLAVLERAAEQRQPHARVGDVRDGRDHHAALCDELAHAAQQGAGVAQMLEDVREQHRVEPLAAELGLEVELLRVADEHALGVNRRELRGLRVELDADDARAEPVAQRLGHVARRAAELQHPRAGLDEAQHEVVGRAGAIVERCALSGGAVVAERHRRST